MISTENSSTPISEILLLSKTRLTTAFWRGAVVTLACLGIAGCSMFGPIDTSLSAPTPLSKPPRQAAAGAPAFGPDTPVSLESEQAQGTRFFNTPVPPGPRAPAAAPALQSPSANASDVTLSAVTLDGLPLPQFASTIYATILKRNVSLDPAVQSRTDLVSLRTGKPQTAAQLASAAQTVPGAYRTFRWRRRGIA